MPVYSCEFHHADTPARLAQDLADYVAAHLRAGLSQRGHALLVVSGGTTPIPFFDALSRADLNWAQVCITLADERWVPADHADSNERLVRAHLLTHHAAQARWQPLKTSDAMVQDGLPAVERALAGLPWPADVVVLGMGGDGHTASLFPHDPALAQGLLPTPATRCVAVQAPVAPNVPVPRISLNRRALQETRQKVVHVTGESKWRLLQEALKPGAIDDLPIRLALETAPCHVFHAP